MDLCPFRTALAQVDLEPVLLREERLEPVIVSEEHGREAGSGIIRNQDLPSFSYANVPWSSWCLHNTLIDLGKIVWEILIM